MRKIKVSLSEIKKKYYNEGKSQSQIGIELGVSQWVISDRIRRNNLFSLSKTRKLNPWKYKINHNAFDHFDEHVAWWIGWMVSDGFVLNDRRFGLKVAMQDADIVQKFKKFLSYTGPIYRQKDKISGKEKIYHQVAIIPTSRRIVVKLNKYGVIPKKSLFIKFPTALLGKTEESIRAFIRGVFEGDGSLLLDKNKSLIFQIVGTCNLCYGIQKQFIKYIGVGKTKLTHNIKNSNHYALRYRGKYQALSIMQWLYYNAGKDVLNRKFNSYLAIKDKLS